MSAITPLVSSREDSPEWCVEGNGCAKYTHFFQMGLIASDRPECRHTQRSPGRATAPGLGAELRGGRLPHLSSAPTAPLPCPRWAVPPQTPIPSCPSMSLSRAHGNSQLSSTPCWCPQGLVWREVGVASSLCLNLAFLLCCSLLDLALEPLGVSVDQGPQVSSAFGCWVFLEFLSVLLGCWSQWAKSTRLIVDFYSKSFKLALIFKAHLWSLGKVPPLGNKGKNQCFHDLF